MDDPHPAPDRDDAAAIARPPGDRLAFEQVFQRHLAAVHAFAERRVGRDLAEEVAAETFTRAFATWRRFDPARASVLPWLFGIASNVLRRHWRSERRRLTAYARSLRDDRPGELPGDSGALIAAVARLPRRQREVLLLHAWADLGYAEIAQALELPIGTVRSRLSRARAALAPDAAAAVALLPVDSKKEPSHA